jgi:hypothetical protein
LVSKNQPQRSPQSLEPQHSPLLQP